MATPQIVRQVRNSVVDLAAAAGIQGDRLDDVRLAVSEAVTNVVVHAYPERMGEVHVVTASLASEFWVLIADDGCGCKEVPRSRGLGWGLALITDACDEFTLAERADGGTEAQMCFWLAGHPDKGSPAGL